jgi:hypothetical protein
MRQIYAQILQFLIYMLRITIKAQPQTYFMFHNFEVLEVEICIQTYSPP